MSEPEAPRLWSLIAELTYRCPLHCPYCSNPVALGDFPDTLSAADWSDVFAQAAALGCLHVGLTGGEPSARKDLPEIVAGAEAAGLFAHLVTAGLPIKPADLPELRDAGLRGVQLSLQDVEPASADHIAGARAHAHKLAFAKAVRAEGLSLTLNFVLHRANLARVREMIELARELDAVRVELANVQLHGWALANREALLPSSEMLETAARVVREEQTRGPRPEIVFVLPDYYSGRPKPCSGGWGRRQAVIAPDGRVLPCHAAAELPLEFWRVPERSLADCWADAPGMNAFRGEAWMPEPCRSCPERSRDFGGCRCQAFALTGQAAVTDPACDLAPHHEAVTAARRAAEGRSLEEFRYRTAGASRSEQTFQPDPVRR